MKRLTRLVLLALLVVVPFSSAVASSEDEPFKITEAMRKAAAEKTQASLREKLRVPSLRLVRKTLDLGVDEYVSYDVLLGKLTAAQFDFLQSHFRFPRSGEAAAQVAPTAYSAHRDYRLIDFMPPKMQATHHQTFFARQSAAWLAPLVGNTDHEFEFSVNCWAFTHDLLISDRIPTISFLYSYSEEEAEQVLSDPERTRAIHRDEARPFDYFYVFEQDGAKRNAIHAGVLIEGGLIYQKSGDSEIDPYVFGLLDIEGPAYASQAVRRNQGKVEIRRVEKSLADPITIWSGKRRGQISASELTRLPAEKASRLVVSGTGAGRSFALIQPIRLTPALDGTYQMNPADPLSKRFIPVTVLE